MPITVGNATSRPGEKVSGFITVPAGSDPGTQIPVTIVAGPRDGPVLALIAGVHGSEPSPIVALQRVRAMLDPALLSGTVIIVQIANPPSFRERTVYRGPWDKKNLNRMFPGKADGTASERIAHAITTQVIDACDCLVDMHAGDANEALRSYCYWNKLGLDEAVDARAREMCLAFGLDHIAIDHDRPRDPTVPDYCANAAQLRGKPTVLSEVGQVGIPTEEAVEINIRGAFRVMRFLKMLPGPVEMVAHPRWIDPSVVVRSSATGLWYATVTPDDTVTKGQIVGHLTDYFGAQLAEVRSPMDGTVIYVVASPAMNEGEPLVMIGKVSD